MAAFKILNPNIDLQSEFKHSILMCATDFTQVFIKWRARTLTKKMRSDVE